MESQMGIFTIIFSLCRLSQGCLAMQSNAPPCSICPRDLGNTNLIDGQCAVHRTCVSCTETHVDYHRIGECLTATVTCPSPSSSPRLRLLKKDNSYTDIEYTTTLNDFSCTGDGWSFTDSTGKVILNIKQAICFGTADGFQQSPITLNTTNATHTSLYDAGQFMVKYGSGIIQKIELTKGYAGFHVDIDPNAPAFFTASHLDARYRLIQYHGHWNENGQLRGSEHIINGVFYPAEFHFVHIREDFTTLAEAAGQDGVAVIAVLAKLSGIDNPNLKPLIDAIANFILLEPDKTEGEVNPDEDVFQQDPADLIPGNHNYLAYTGSLTTPDTSGVYQKCVAWNVLYQTITISQNQLDVLGQLKDMNFRELQTIDTRTTVYTSDVRNNRKPIEEEEEEENIEKEDEIENHALKPFPSFIQNKKEEKEDVEVDVMEGIELTQDEMEFLHRLRNKYNRRKNELRSKLLEWMR